MHGAAVDLLGHGHSDRPEDVDGFARATSAALTRAGRRAAQ